MDRVKHVILVKSVKGGVGKSTVSAQLALSLWESNFKVGILDIDLCGPSIPYLLDLKNQDVLQGPDGKWVPIYKTHVKENPNKLAVMSIAFLLQNEDDPIIWRGPKKTAMIRQFIKDIEWGDLDYLIVDTPPGTSDEHITVAECMKDPAYNVNCDGVVIVTTPQEVALEDVRKEITFCRKTNLNILGIVENMSGYVCPACRECTAIFSTGGGEALAKRANIPLLGSLPIDSRIHDVTRIGCSVISGLDAKATASIVFQEIVQQLTTTTIE